MEIGGGFFGTIISALVVGLIVGALGRLIVPGKQDMPIWLTIVIGIIAALLGTAIMASFTGSFWLILIVQVLLAAAGVYLVSMMRGRRRRQTPV
ncbi:GlsB/YeaQ/YmgE family stress response membrane protein [Thermobifida halotolerans]|uniref:GlsB/YeaQ/YmgE family stress response membrane protein n=1 Tax=Thermobifida halotolerans TaxID=483545 RepID=A0A399FUI1_9ACTN|nr:GlsB/YeaQ/YmgE family stress response membrane protein [Thermobifida halotolerans]UOE18832.1 GlsB/YeaQ/YmgE family stress response membrane protein [Thermobifida halotolerans]